MRYCGSDDAGWVAYNGSVGGGVVMLVIFTFGATFEELRSE